MKQQINFDPPSSERKVQHARAPILAERWRFGVRWQSVAPTPLLEERAAARREQKACHPEDSKTKVVIISAEMTLRNGHPERSVGGKVGEAQSRDPAPTARGALQKPHKSKLSDR